MLTNDMKTDFLLMEFNEVTKELRKVAKDRKIDLSRIVFVYEKKKQKIRQPYIFYN